MLVIDENIKASETPGLANYWLTSKMFESQRVVLWNLDHVGRVLSQPWNLNYFY